MIEPSDLVAPLVTTVVLIALTGVLPISNAETGTDTDESEDMAAVLISRRQIAAVLAIIALIASVIVSVEHLFRSAAPFQ
jgi:uncharacterized paraquat-inducible protein A